MLEADECRLVLSQRSHVLKPSDECVEYAHVLATAVAHPITQTPNSRDVIVAIVGGTMLSLALTRPRLRWVEQLTKGSDFDRRWAERSLTIFAFAMAGYAYNSLAVVLYKQLGWDARAMLKGAAAFMAVYAWLVHFEPFLAEWRLRGGPGTMALYTCIAIFAFSIGMVIADVVLLSSFQMENLRFLLITGAVAVGGWIVYKLLPRLEALLDRVLTSRTDVRREVLAGEGGAPGDKVGGCALEDNLAAVVAGAGAEVDDPVGVRHDRLVVRDDDHRLAGVDEPVE
jgi:hypothetical protein